MKILNIELIPNDEFLMVSFALEPSGSLTLRLSRNSGMICRNRMSRGEAHLVFITKPEGGRYYQDNLEALVQGIHEREFLGIGSHGQLLFENIFEIQPGVELVPRDLLDNSQDVLNYSSDTSIQGLDNRQG